MVRLIQAYTESTDVSIVNWDAVLECSFDGMSGWLEYSIGWVSRKVCFIHGRTEWDSTFFNVSAASWNVECLEISAGQELWMNY